LFLGFVQIHTNRVDRGIAECQQALALDHNLALAYGIIGLAKVFAGHPEETESHVLEALRLSPRDNEAYNWIMFVGVAKLCLSRDEEAVEWLHRSVESNRNIPVAHFHLAAALAQLGRLDEARAAVAAGLALNPTFTIRRYRKAVRSEDAVVRAQGYRLVEAMRKAGVPEG
jgi:Flp pilus assembly protein TadD